MHLRSIAKGSTASFTDDVSSIRAVAEFFGSDESRMLGCRHEPEGTAKAGVVICSSIQSEFIGNYRREFLLAKSMASQGLAVQRFHYRGTGNSDGEAGSATFESMRDDALSAADLLIEESGVTALAFVGTRWGALVAASAASDFDGAPVALWQPVINPRDFFKEIFRLRLMHELKDGSQNSSSQDALRDEMSETGSLDILGNWIHRGLYESAINRSLTDELGNTPRPVLLAQTSAKQQLSRDYAELVNHLVELEFAVESQVVSDSTSWWFVGERWQPDEGKDSTKVLIEGTLNWVTSRLGVGA